MRAFNEIEFDLSVIRASCQGCLEKAWNMRVQNKLGTFLDDLKFRQYGSATMPPMLL
jgi:hypothetical protein